ncbi:MAG: hypothetical protein JST00_24655 [Deltaproteobacteria bacterium]|nr:hypothetical protein [Deltaproteobacteria bacterium]
MDQAIRAAWNAFWVGVGASAILIGQTFLTPPAPPPPPPSLEEPAPAPPPPSKPMVAVRASRLG